jgi:3'-phosphoadenosine 5'-phosphosulfate (PAPS) 3'-phosphatase
MINQQRQKDRSYKALEKQQEYGIKKRNKKILQTVNEHFPQIDIISREEKHHDAIAQLAKPRLYDDK